MKTESKHRARSAEPQGFSTRWEVWLALFLLLLLGPSRAEAKTILVLISSYGGGHISQARAIEARAKARGDDSLRVVVKDTTDFMFSPTWLRPLDLVLHENWYRDFDKYVFWMAMRRLPQYMARETETFFEAGNYADDIFQVHQFYDIARFERYVDEIRPDAVLAAHYGSAQLVARVRARGRLRTIPTGYLVSELVEGLGPRISMGTDRTFLPDPSFVTVFTDRGVPAERLEVTGLPVSERSRQPLAREERREILTGLGLDPALSTVFLASGAEGLGDFPKAVRALLDQGSPKNVIVICGRNAAAEAELNKLKATHSQGGRLSVSGFVANDVLIDRLRASDVFVGKPGGGLAVEAISAGTPLVFLDFARGWEIEIARRLVDLGYGTFCPNLSELGATIDGILGSSQERFKTARAQYLAASENGAERLLDFALQGQSVYEPFPERLGDVANDLRGYGLAHALSRSDLVHPHEQEILFYREAGKLRAAIQTGGVVVFRTLAGNRLLELPREVFLFGDSNALTRDPRIWASGVAYSGQVLGVRLKHRLFASANPIENPIPLWREVRGFGTMVLYGPLRYPEAKTLHSKSLIDLLETSAGIRHRRLPRHIAGRVTLQPGLRAFRYEDLHHLGVAPGEGSFAPANAPISLRLETDFNCPRALGSQAVKREIE